MIKISYKAMRELKRILIDEEEEGKAIRIFSSRGTCGGSSLGMDIADKFEDADVIFDNTECPVFIDKRAFDELKRATIDYINDGAQRGLFLRGLLGWC